MHSSHTRYLTPFLLITTAIVSPAYSADISITSPGSFIIAPGSSVEFQAENGATTSSFAQVNGGVTIGSVTATASGVGVLNLAGDGATVDGNVGNLFRTTIGGTGNMGITGSVANTGAFYSQAGTLTVGGDFQNSYVNFTSNRDGTLILNGAANSISTVLTTGSTGSVGTITFGPASSTTVTGAVGGTARIKRLNLDGTLATFNANVSADALNFGADGTASIRGTTVNASITTSTDGTGTLSFQPTAQSTVNGTIGSNTHGLKRIEMKSGTGSIVRITQAAYADEVAVDGLGTLILDTASRLDTSSGSARAATGSAVTFTKDGLLSISTTDVRIGSVTTAGGTAGQGRITFSGSGTVTLGAGIGTGADRLRQINISNAGMTLATAPSSANYVSTVRFSADGTLYLDDGASLTGDVTTATDRRGTLVFRGGTGAVIQGDVGSGAAQIKALQVGGHGSGTVDGSIYAETISFGADPGAVLTVTGNIVGDVGGTPGGGGALVFSGATTTGGNIGTTSPLRSVVFQGAGISTLMHDVDAAAAAGSGVRIAGPGTTLRIGSSGKTITGPFDNGGVLDLGANTVTVAGNISGTGSIAFTVGASGTGYIVNTTNTANYAPGAGTVAITPTVIGTTVADGAKIALIRGAVGSTGPDIASTTFTVAGTSTLTWTVASGAAHVGVVDLNGHAITAADTVLVASVGGGSPGPTDPPTDPPTGGVIDTSKPVFTDGDGAVQGATVTFAGGVLKPAAGLTLPQAIVVTAANGTIDPDGNTVTLSGTVGGSGVLTVGGPGTVVVSGSVANTGGLVVQQGRLVVAEGGRVEGPITIGGGGTLGGTGTLTGPAVVSGILAPGNSPGTLTLSAPLTLTASSTFQAEIDGPATGAGAGSHDRVVLTGNGSSFTAAGTLSPILRGITGPATNSYTPEIGRTFGIVDAQGGVSGQFATIAQPGAGLPAGTRFDAIYGANTVTLAVTPTGYGDLAAAGLSQTAAGRAAGTALDAVRPAAGTRPADDAKPFYDGLYTLSGAQAADAMERLAGTLHADTLSAGLTNRRLFGHVVEARQAATRGGDAWTQGGAFSFATAGGQSGTIASLGVPGAWDDASSAPAADRGFTVWGKPLLSWGRTDADANAPGSTRRGGGVMLGGEFATDHGVTAGLAVGYLHTEVESAGKGEVDSYQATLYAGWTAGGTFVDAALGYGHSRYDTSRASVVAGLGLTAGSSADGDDWSAEIGAGHRFTLGTAWFEPRAGLRWERVQRDAFTESGAGPWSLGVGAQTVTALRGSIGARMGTVMQAGGLTLEPTAMLAWEHDFRDTAAGGTHGFAGTAFQVSGAEPGRDAALIGAGIAVRLTDTLKASVGYTGELREGDTAHTATAGLRLSF